MLEVMFASIVTAFLLTALYKTDFLLENAKYQYATDIDLNNRARQVVDKMAWGVRQSGQANRRGIAEAVSATVTPTQIDYTDINAAVHSIRISNGVIQYRRGAAGAWTTYLDPNGSFAYDATTQSTALTFSQTNASAVTINLVLGKILRGRWYYASVKTSIAFRNA